jgi:hypothetical protein
MNIRGPRTDPLGTSFFKIPQLEKKFWVLLGELIATCCLLLVKQDLNQSADTPQLPQKCNSPNKISWFMQSKAFTKSQNILHRAFCVW